MPKKNDNIVGQSEGPILNGGRQTAEQAAITEQGNPGRTDAERNAEWNGDAAQKGRMDPAIGGSSNGHSDQLAARGPDENRKVAGGRYQTEQSHGTEQSVGGKVRGD